MDAICPGMAVFSIDDRELGNVVSLKPCCFEVGRTEGSLFLKADSVFHIVVNRIT